MADAFIMARERTTPPPWHGGGGGIPSGDGIWDRFTDAGAVRMQKLSGGGRWGGSYHGWEYDAGNDNFIGTANSTTAGTNIQARFTTPTPVLIGSDTDAGNLPFCTVVSTAGTDGFTDIADGLTGIPSLEYVGGIIIDGTDIWWVVQPNYAAAPESQPVLGRSDNDASLATLNGDGIWVTDIHFKKLCTYGCIIPQTIADTHLGGRRLLMGSGPVAGNALSSFGPSAIAVGLPAEPYDPLTQVLTTKTMLDYPDGNNATLENGLPWNGASRVYNVVWIEDGTDDWIVFMCLTARGIEWYGNAADYPHYQNPITGVTEDPYNLSKGYHAPPYRAELWVYHFDDLLPVINGTEDSWTPVPREKINVSPLLFQREEFRRDSTVGTPVLSEAYFSMEVRALSLMWMPVAKRLWLMESRGDWLQSAFEEQPVLHAFDLDAA